MVDIKILRENPEIIKGVLQKRGVELDIDEILALDARKREMIKEIEKLRAERNQISSSVKDNPDLMVRAKQIKDQLKKLEDELKEVETEFDKLFLLIPNIPLADVPQGRNEEDNVVIKEWGKKPKINFQSKDHIELGRDLDLIDIERASKISGSRFGILKNETVLLEFALIKLAFDVLTKEGFSPVVPPTLIKPEMMKAMGYIETDADLAERYFLEKDGLFLVGTAEQAIGPMHQGETLETQDLPKHYVAFSSCFREEAGSYGKDTRGIFRVHQFDKVEMFSFTKPEESPKEHLYLLGLTEKLMQMLEIPYQVVRLCTGDLARPAAATYDIEAWIPSQERFRETQSISNCTDFQARRLNIRYKKEKENKTEFVHTLNGTAFAIGRMLIAILENYQQKDGKVVVPKVLRKYVGRKLIFR